jgi:hypothetical protein
MVGGDGPEGFVPRDEIVECLEQYASSLGAPVHSEWLLRACNPD